MRHRQKCNSELMEMPCDAATRVREGSAGPAQDQRSPRGLGSRRHRAFPLVLSYTSVDGASPLTRWPAALLGLFLAMFAVLALSGPGRLDIVDGHTRYETARSLVDHHDCVIRDPDVWFNVFPGRDGNT